MKRTRLLTGAGDTFARAAHGKAKDGGVLLVVESRPRDELRKAAQPGPPIARDRTGRVATAEDARRLALLPRTGRTRVPKAGRAYRVARGAELEAAHGHVSEGVGAMLDAEACAWLAGSRAGQRAAETGDRGDIQAMSTAYELARALAKDAWTLAGFESGRVDKRPAADPNAAAAAAFTRKEQT